MILQSNLSYSSIGMFAFFVVVMALYYYQAFKKKYKIPYLLLGVTAGVLGTMINLIFLLLGDSSSEIGQALFIILLSTVALAFFLFFESVNSLHPRFARTAPILVCYIFIFIVNIIRLVPSLPLDLDASFDLLAMSSYAIIGIMAYGFIGIPYYLKVYRLTHERISFLLFVAMGVGTLTYSLIFVKHTIIPSDAPYGDDLVTVIGLLSSAFIAVFALTYVFNLDYVYRLPFDNYIIMIATRTGIPIQKIELESSKQPEIKDILITGLLSAVNNLFMEALQASTDIENISSQDATVIIKTGKYSTVMVIGERATAKLADATERFLEAFENRYQAELSRNESEMSLFKSAKELVPPIFPFFKIKGEKRKK